MKVQKMNDAEVTMEVTLTVEQWRAVIDGLMDAAKGLKRPQPKWLTETLPALIVEAL